MIRWTGWIAMAALTLVVSACSATRTGGEVKSAPDYRTISADEWQSFADTMVQSIVSTGVLDRYRADGDPARVGIGSWKNDTDNVAFTRQKNVMLNAVRKSLVNSGQVVVSGDVAASDSATNRDQLTRDVGQLRDSEDYDPDSVFAKGTLQAPQLSLQMSIVDITSKAVRTTTKEYAVDCKLIDLRTKYSCWEDQVVLPKQFTKGIFGE
ncbi:MAG: hypothetical protein ACO3ZY_11395 [Phycisphaerales bacterium]